MAKRKKTPQFYYNQQKQSAKARGIAWEFADWQEWFAVWEASGKWERRGKGKGQFVMSRRGDQGPYASWNVEIIEAGMNGSQALKSWPAKKVEKEKQKLLQQTEISA